MFAALLLAVISRIAITESKVMCNGLLFHGVYYDKQLLFEGMGKPYNLIMHKKSGLLFFSHTIRNGSIVDFGVMACHIEKRTCHDIPGVPGGYAVAHDRINDNIYFGGHDGIYKYDFKKKVAKFFAEKNKSIWGLYVGYYFYYIEYPTQKLYIYDRNRFLQVVAASKIEVDNFFISKKHCYYFSNRTGLYKVHMHFKRPIALSRNLTVRQITDDIHGDMYFCTNDGIYVENAKEHKIKKVIDAKDCFGLTFMRASTSKNAKDVVMYSSKDSVYRLVPSKYSRICTSIIQKAKQHIIKQMRLNNLRGAY